MKNIVDEAVRVAKERGLGDIEIGIVLGSGLAPLAKDLKVEAELPTTEIPGYPKSTVTGHEGRFLVGQLGGRRVLMLKGRLHGYEGYDLAMTTLPIRMMRELGAKVLVITNGAGGIDLSFRPGDVMIIDDHINLMGRSPLGGPNVDEWGPRFPDMSEVYDAELRNQAEALGTKLGLNMRRGVYLATPGPQYETPSEVRMMRLLGGQAVGMSSVPEAIVGRHMGFRILGLSVITNAAAGVEDETVLSHAEVVEAGEAAGPLVSQLVATLIEGLPKELTP